MLITPHPVPDSHVAGTHMTLLLPLSGVNILQPRLSSPFSNKYHNSSREQRRLVSSIYSLIDLALYLLLLFAAFLDLFLRNTRGAEGE